MATSLAATCLVFMLLLLELRTQTEASGESENFFDPTDHGDYYEGDHGIFLPESHDDDQDNKNGFYTFNAEEPYNEDDDYSVNVEEKQSKKKSQKKPSLKSKVKPSHFLKKKRSLEPLTESKKKIVNHEDVKKVVINQQPPEEIPEEHKDVSGRTVKKIDDRVSGNKENIEAAQNVVEPDKADATNTETSTSQPQHELHAASLESLSSQVEQSSTDQSSSDQLATNQIPTDQLPTNQLPSEHSPSNHPPTDKIPSIQPPVDESSTDTPSTHQESLDANLSQTEKNSEQTASIGTDSAVDQTQSPIEQKVPIAVESNPNPTQPPTDQNIPLEQESVDSSHATKEDIELGQSPIEPDIPQESVSDQGQSPIEEHLSHATESIRNADHQEETQKQEDKQPVASSVNIPENTKDNNGNTEKVVPPPTGNTVQQDADKAVDNTNPSSDTDQKSQSDADSQLKKTQESNAETNEAPSGEEKLQVKDPKIDIETHLSKVYDSDPLINEAMQSEKFREIRKKQLTDYIDSHFKGKELTSDFLDMIDRHITNSLRHELRKENSHLRTMFIGESVQKKETSHASKQEDAQEDVNTEHVQKSVKRENKDSSESNNKLEEKQSTTETEASITNDAAKSESNTENILENNEKEKQVDNQQTKPDIPSLDNAVTAKVNKTDRIESLKAKRFSMRNAIKGIRPSHKLNIVSESTPHSNSTVETTITENHDKSKNVEAAEQKEQKTTEEELSMKLKDEANIQKTETPFVESDKNIEPEEIPQSDQQVSRDDEAKDKTIETETINEETSPVENNEKTVEENKEASGGFFGGIFNMFSGSEEPDSSAAEVKKEEIDKKDSHVVDNESNENKIESTESLNVLKTEEIKNENNDKLIVNKNSDEEKKTKDKQDISMEDKDQLKVVAESVLNGKKEDEDSEEKGKVKENENESLKKEQKFSDNIGVAPKENTADNVNKKDTIRTPLSAEVVENTHEKDDNKQDKIEIKKESTETLEHVAETHAETEKQNTNERNSESEKLTESNLNEIFQSFKKIDEADLKENTEETEKSSHVQPEVPILTTTSASAQSSLNDNIQDSIKESVDMEHEKSKYVSEAQDFHKNDDKEAIENEEAISYFNQLPDEDPMKSLCLQHPLLQACKNILKKRASESKVKDNLLDEKLSKETTADESKPKQSVSSYIKTFTRSMNSIIYSVFETIIEFIRSSFVISFQYTFGILLTMFGQSQVTENIVARFYAISVGAFALIIMFIMDHLIFYWYYANSSFGPSVKIVENLQNENSSKISQEEIDELTDKIEIMEKNISEKTSKEHQLVEKITKLEQELLQANCDIDDLKTELQKEKESKLEIEKQNEQLLDVKSELKDTLSDKDAEMKVSQQTIQAMKKEEEKKKTELKKMEEKFFFVIKDLDTKDAKLEKMGKKQKELESQIEEKGKTITELEDTLCQNSNICDELNGEKKTLESKLEDEKKIIDTLKVEIQVLQESLASMSVSTPNGDTTSDEFEKIDQEKLSEEGDVSKAETLQKIMDSTKLQAELRQISQELISSKNDLNETKLQYEEVQKSHLVLKQKFDELSIQSDETNKLLEKRDIELKTIRDFFADRESEFHRTNVKNSEEMKSLKKQLLMFGESEGQLANLMKQIDELKEEILTNERQYKQQIASSEEQAHSHYIKMRSAVRECDEHKREKEIYRKRLLDIDVSPQFKKTTLPLSTVRNNAERAESPSNSAKSGDDNKSDSPNPSTVALPQVNSTQVGSMYSPYPRPPTFGAPPPRPPMGPYPGPPRPPPFMSPMHPMSFPPRPPGMPPRPPFGMNQHNMPMSGPPMPPGQHMPMSTPQGPNMPAGQANYDQFRRPPPNFPGYSTPTMNGSSGPSSANVSLQNTPNHSMHNTPVKGAK